MTFRVTRVTRPLIHEVFVIVRGSWAPLRRTLFITVRLKLGLVGRFNYILVLFGVQIDSILNIFSL